MDDAHPSLSRSFELSCLHVADAASPFTVAGLLADARIRYVLIGGHALAYLTASPRATVDVDVLLAIRDVPRAEAALRAAFPHLHVEDLVYNVRFLSRTEQPGRDPERIDLVRADEPVFQRVIERHAIDVPCGGTTIRLPTAEAAVALKFAAAISPHRGAGNKPQDGVDLDAVLRRHHQLDAQVLAELGDLVYPGGGRELVDYVAAFRAGRPRVL